MLCAATMRSTQGVVDVPHNAAAREHDAPALAQLRMDSASGRLPDCQVRDHAISSLGPWVVKSTDHRFSRLMT
jgi:hypothetical protein